MVHQVTPYETEDRESDLDALCAIIPAKNIDAVAHLLTNKDVQTLRHLAEKGMGENSMKALTYDLRYIEFWHMAAIEAPLIWPAPLDVLLKFVAHHLWDADEKRINPDHGMPDEVRDRLVEQGALRKPGPHAPATVRRRLASWSTLHHWKGYDGAFKDQSLKKAIRLAVRASPRARHRNSKEAITADVTKAVLAILDKRINEQSPFMARASRASFLRAARDRAIISLGFAAGGRRRSEIAQIQVGQLSWKTLERKDEDEGQVRYLDLTLGRSKTMSAEEGFHVAVHGRVVRDVRYWMEAAEIDAGPLFRAIDLWGNVSGKGIGGQSINSIIKRRIEETGLDPADFSAHGLRSGYLTEAFKQGLSLPEAMQQSGHKSVAQAMSYFNQEQGVKSRSGRLLD